MAEKQVEQHTLTEYGAGEREAGKIPPYSFHGGRLIGRILADNGIKHVFGVHGGHIWPLESGFYEYGIKRLHMRHEQSGVYAAEAYGRCMRQPGVCYGTAGPGVTNMLTGINQAHQTASPVVAILGQHTRDEDLRGGFQESYGVELTRSITKWSHQVLDWHSIPVFLRKALRDSMEYPCGPIALVMEPRVLALSGEEAILRGDIPNQAKARPTLAAADPKAVDKLVEMILAAERPVMVVGDGAYWADAGAELQEFVELVQLPTNCRRKSRGSLPETHPLAVGADWRIQFWKDADLFVFLGIRLESLEMFGNPPVYPIGPKRVVVNESMNEGWDTLPTAMEIIANPKMVLRQMIECARDRIKKPVERKAWVERLAKAKQNAEESKRSMAKDVWAEIPGRVHPAALGQAIADFLDDSATVVLDSHTGSAYVTERIQATFPEQVLDGGLNGGVGQGVGMGIGAQLARPGKQVLVMMGDAGMGIGGMDIETAARYNLPVVYVVYNNSTWMGGVYEMVFKGQIDPWSMLPDIRYDKMFEYCGCHAENVTSADEIRPALERAFNSGKTAVVNVMADSRVGNPIAIGFATQGIFVDFAKVPEETRDVVLQGLTPEVEAKLKAKGWPTLLKKGKVHRSGTTPAFKQREEAKAAKDTKKKDASK